MTHTMQELEAIVATCKAAWEAHVKVEGEDLARDYRAAEIALLQAAIVAIPELIAVIKELDPGYNAAPTEDAAARVKRLEDEATAKRAKLEGAIAKAGMGDTKTLDELGLEAFLDDNGEVKIRQKRREATAP